MDHRIRHANPDDIEEIIKLCAEHAEFERAEYSSDDGKAQSLAKNLFADQPRLFCFVAENNAGYILGFTTFIPEFSTWDASFYIHMDCLYLRPHARNFGIGKKFIREIAKFAKEGNYKQIQWQTPSFNERGMEFYKRLGAVSKEKFRLYLDEKKIEELAK